MILAATGHRPNKLGGYSKEATFKLRKIAWEFLKMERPDKVISGMALGWDMAWAEAAIALNIPVIAAVPFPGQEKAWPEESQKRFKKILSQCERVEIVSPGPYKPYLLQVRNQWMVDNCDILIGLWDGTTGGTYNCVKYSRKLGKPFINLYEEYLND